MALFGTASDVFRRGGLTLAAVMGNSELRVNCAQGERSEFISTLALAIRGRRPLKQQSEAACLLRT